ncbi:hypothetical protein [uncultured Marinobacter sp.]|uniref:hypothetical protein n=1 Tax=uncultured Marinobacter sp. TaxID=187379 RepID=UPI002594823D|nr:hypothetical protein [uncultured Marinobacter sp.]
MSSQDVVELEMNIKEAKELVELGKSLERLEKNRDFKKVIQEHYLNKEAVRLVHAKGDAAMQDPKHQANILRDIDGIGSFTQFLNFLRYQAEMAKDAIRECEDVLDDLRAEGADE